MGRACPVCASSIELDRDLDLDLDRRGLGWDGITDGNQIPSALHGRHRLRLDPADQGRSTSVARACQAVRSMPNGWTASVRMELGRLAVGITDVNPQTG
jgi:hypothetical protein